MNDARAQRLSGTHDRNVGDTDAQLISGRREILTGVLHLTAVLSDAMLAAHDFSTNNEVAILTTLHVAGPQRPRKLTALTGMTRAGTTNLVDRFERTGLVHRRPANGDDRGVLVELTTDGAIAVGAMVERVTHSFAKAAPWMAPWGQLLHDMGIDAGPLRLPAGGVRRRLDYIREVSALGRVSTPLYDEAFGPDTVAPHQVLYVLLLASEPGGTQPTQVADALLLSSATTSDLLRRVEDDGLIARNAGRPPSDRRVTTVTATERGHEAVDSILHRADDLMRAIAHVFFPD